MPETLPERVQKLCRIIDISKCLNMRKPCEPQAHCHGVQGLRQMQTRASDNGRMQRSGNCVQSCSNKSSSCHLPWLSWKSSDLLPQRGVFLHADPPFFPNKQKGCIALVYETTWATDIRSQLIRSINDVHIGSCSVATRTLPCPWVGRTCWNWDAGIDTPEPTPTLRTQRTFSVARSRDTESHFRLLSFCRAQLETIW